eukprot:scaffold28910_cov40-Attheya_sp.AAC.5
MHIVDTCLNFLRRFFIARRLLHHIHDHHKLAKGQWGGIPGRTAIDLVMSKEMMITILHLLCKNGAITDVDATACYNRMVPALLCVCNPASTTDNLCPTLGGGIPTRTGRLRATTLSSLNCYLCRLPTLTIVEASRLLWGT